VLLREVDPNSEWPVIEAMIELRLKVWSAQVTFPLTLEDVIDRFEHTARHWGVFDGERCVAAARLSFHDNVEDVPEAVCLSGVSLQAAKPIAFMSRLVVDADYRRRGLGQQLDEIRIRAAEEAQCGSLLAIVLDVSGEGRVKRFLSYGFTVRGRGVRDTHPKFCLLPAPLVVERVNMNVLPDGSWTVVPRPGFEPGMPR
jgi:GNAT superfamily N-acetyltransferase